MDDAASRALFGRDRELADLEIALAEAMTGRGSVALVSGRARSSADARCAHVLIREVLYQAIPSARRARLHMSAAAILCELHAADLDAHVAELAHHFFEAGPLGAWEPAVEYAARAGHRAMALFAFDDAARHFERGLAAVDRGPPDRPGSPGRAAMAARRSDGGGRASGASQRASGAARRCR